MVFMYQGQSLSGGGSGADENVKQTETTTDAEYEILFSGTADNTTRTEGAGKNEGMTYNPNYGSLMVGLRYPGSAIGLKSMGVGHGITTSGEGSFATGTKTIASGSYSHAEGGGTTASGMYSHAEGGGTVAWGDYQHVQGKYNVKDTNLIYAHIVGNGTSSARSNAYALRWDGQQDVTNDIVRVDTNGTWDGVHASLTDALTDKATKSIIANEYDNTATYEYGDYCIYENVLYLCDALQIVAEDFDPTKWIATSIAAENIGFTNWIKTKVSKTGGAMSGQLAGITSGGSWKLARDNASFKKTGAQNTSTYYPILSVRGYDYDWSMGTLGNDSNKRLYFVRTFDSDYSGTGNKTQKFGLYGGSSGADSEYVIAHSGNVGTGDSNGQVKIAGTNVSVKGLAAAAYRDVFSRSSTGDIGWGTTANHTKVLEDSAIAFWNGCYSGGSSNLQYCDRGRFGTIVTKGSGDYLPINPANIEFTNKDWHFLDFHYQGSTDDFTARIIEEAKGTFRIYYRLKVNENYMVLNQYGGYRMYHGGNDLVCQMRSGGKGVIEFLQTGGYGTWATCKAKAFSVQSSKWIKENINDLTEEEALKLLNLRPVTFDYTDGVTKNCRGLIAEEAYEELPYCVDMPEEYLNLDHDPILEADKDEDTDIGILPSIDYSKFVPHLIKLCQIQQKQIDALTERVSELESKLN